MLLTMLLTSLPYLYCSCPNMELPMVPSGIATPKLSAIVAPVTAKVCVSSSLPLPWKDGEYARNGTFSLVWSVPV